MKSRCLLVLVAWALLGANSRAADPGRGIKVIPADGTWVRQTDLAEVGDYFALVIGIDAYKDFAPLRCAARDAEAVAQVLKEDYGFKEVVLLLNDAATDKAIKEALYTLRRKVTPKDSVLVYYAGHGTLDGAGYWLPVNARRDSDVNHLLHSEIRERVNKACLPARHVLLVADSCYAGALFRAAEAPKDVTPPYVQEALRKPSRLCMTSGGQYPVPDGRPGGHSVFANYFLQALRSPPRNAFVPSDIFPDLKYNVSVNSPRVDGQTVTPILGVLAESGHERGGEFVFFRRRLGDTIEPPPEEPKTDWKKEKEELDRRKAEQEALERWLAQARLAYNICLAADKADYVTPQDKASKWEKYLLDYERSGVEVAFARERLQFWRNWRPGPVLPQGWTSEKRRVKVATPAGEEWKEITCYKNTLGMEFVKVPGGEFMMGDTLTPEQVHAKWPGGQLEWYKWSQPRHRVRISKDFFIGSVEVTRGQFDAFVRATGYRTDAEKEGKAYVLKDEKWGEQAGASWRNPLFAQDDNHPAVCISWNDAKAFCEWLSRTEGVTYRLPTEAEWEYAARAGSDNHTWYWGNDESGAQGKANVASEGENWTYFFKGVRDGYNRTAPVGRFMPNAFGLHDVIGNAWEWCEDWFDADYYGKSPSTDPKGPAAGALRVLRGGSWYFDPRFSRSAFRSGLTPFVRDSNYGFRVVYLSR